MIELSNITVSFDEKPVLRNLTMTLPREGCVVFRGPSGCGKTTLLRVLAGLINPSDGHINGLADRKISMVFQEDRLLPWQTAKENIALISDGQTAIQLLDAVGLSADADALPSSLSGGMRRRVAIARALAYSDDVLLLDEPFNGLDQELRVAMAALIQKRAKLIVLVTHEEGDIALFEQPEIYTFTQDGSLIRE